MASKAIKRRPCSSETDKKSEKRMETPVPDPVTEPLLGHVPQEEKTKRYEPATRLDFWDGTREECLCWAHLLSIFIAQSARKIVNALSEFGSLVARLFGCSSAPQSSQNGQTVPLNLSPLQVERLKLLRQRLDVPYDCSSVKHQDALKELWRAGGFMSLENLIYFARNFPDSFHRLLHKAEGKRAEWEYPFAAGGVNISYMLVQMLDLQSGKISTKAGVHFVQLLEDDEAAFDNLFCVAFQVLDAQWLARRASYMEFNEVLKSTRVQLEKELTMGRISSVQDLPSFRMLKR
ncbi:ELMO domain-containing protein A-like [Panicum miliaceum]|uniref:ELMO domain-containing protein A-like n=1 Tax=Panicum miliaceum TaxID=4540 RepID=A0A3L6RDU4_PANMI|nr:ELMO domain-containing protein A-like [Panicum miliaceum]